MSPAQTLRSCVPDRVLARPSAACSFWRRYSGDLTEKRCVARGRQSDCRRTDLAGYSETARRQGQPMVIPEFLACYMAGVESQ